MKAEENRPRGDEKDRRHEEADHAIGRPLDRRLSRLRLLHRLHDAGQDGLSAGPDDPDEEPSRPVQRPGDDRIPRDFRHGGRLPGQHRLVRLRSPFDHVPVHRHPLPGDDLHEIPGSKGGDGDVDRSAARCRLPGHHGRQPHEPRDPVGRAGPRSRLDVPAKEDQGQDHRRRVEIHLPPEEQRGGAVAVRGEGAEEDEGVHPERPVARSAEGAEEEGRAGVEDDRGGEEETEPTEKLLVPRVDPLEVAGVEPRGEEHHLHREERRGAEAQQQIRRLPSKGVSGGERFGGVRRVPEGADRQDYVSDPGFRRIPGDSRPAGGEIDARERMPGRPASTAR